jgi:hypothetical protein
MEPERADPKTLSDDALKASIAQWEDITNRLALRMRRSHDVLYELKREHQRRRRSDNNKEGN